jgi:hypothetical protein
MSMDDSWQGRAEVKTEIPALLSHFPQQIPFWLHWDWTCKCGVFVSFIIPFYLQSVHWDSDSLVKQTNRHPLFETCVFSELHWTGLPVCVQIPGPCGPIFTLPSPPPIPPPSAIGYHLPNTPFLNPLLHRHYLMTRPATALTNNMVSGASHEQHTKEYRLRYTPHIIMFFVTKYICVC